jgi:ABC-type antimicrobial peptide transport system, permease component
MIKHLLKQIWALRGKNIWIILELFLVFIILWYIVDFFSVFGITATTPTGTDITNVYRVIYATNKPDNPKYISYEADSEEPGRNLLRMVEYLKTRPEVESVCIGQWYYPYCTSNTGIGYFRDSLKTSVTTLTVSPEYFSMFNVAPINGTDPEVLAKAIQRERSVILSKKAGEDLFKEASATGQFIMNMRDSSQVYVSGVTVEMKTHEFSRPRSFALLLFDENSLLKQKEDQIRLSTDICIKIKPGVSKQGFPARFKDEIKQSLTIGNYFLADIVPMTEQRESFFKLNEITSTLNYRIGIGIFFLVNVFLGVLGTFWLRIEKRKSEIGLRMSLGSTKAKVISHMLTESLCMLGIASIPALLICINLAIMGFLSTQYMDLTVVRFLTTTLITYALFIIVIMLSTLYPALRSANIQPAEALQHE